jgi:hypothetical protein
VDLEGKKNNETSFYNTYRFVGHFLPQFSALLSELTDAHARELGLDRLTAFVHPDEVGRGEAFWLSRQLHLLLLPLALHPTAASSTDKLRQKVFFNIEEDLINSMMCDHFETDQK